MDDIYLNFGEEFKPLTYTVAQIKNLGLVRSAENLQTLLKLYNEVTDIEVKREIVSSIGRQTDNKIIFGFIRENVFTCGFMDLVYQMYRTCLYKGKTCAEFEKLGDEIKSYFDNEVLNKMREYFDYRQSHVVKKKRVTKYDKPILLRGNNVETLKKN